jgi:uncharacterized protein YceK
MGQRKPSPTTTAGIFALVLAVTVLSGCGSTATTAKSPEARAATAEANLSASEHAEQQLARHQADVHPPHNFLASCARLNATGSLCVCFQKKVEAQEPPSQVAVIEFDMAHGVPLPAKVIPYIEECLHHT